MLAHVKYCLLVFALVTPVAAQNRITNPGFEHGLQGWGDLWTRTPGAGVAEVVQNPVHSGSWSLHLVHWGKEDWSMTQVADFPVSPGQIYEFSAWVNVVQPGAWSQLSIAVFDNRGAAIDWGYAPKSFAPTGGEYVEFKTRFVVPENAAYVWPRFIGADSCELFIDDVTFEHVGDLGGGQTYTLQNARLAAKITTPTFAMQVKSKSNNKTYDLAPTYLFNVLSVDSTADSYSFHCELISANADVTVRVSLLDQAVKFEMIPDGAVPLEAPFDFPGRIDSRAGEFFVIPRAAGILLPVEDAVPFWEFGLFAWKSTMAFAGITDLQTGYMLATEDPWDSEFRFVQPAGSHLYTLQFVHQPSKRRLGYPRTFYWVMIENDGYNEMARWYRAFAERLGYVKPFAQKIAENPNVDKLRGAVDFWALEWQFKMPAFLDSLYQFGIDRALISLGGGWRMTDPVAAVIDSINARGMLSSRYDIYTDVWPPTYPDYPWYRTEGYPEDVVVNADGSLKAGWLAYLSDRTPFQGYYTCSATHANYARRWIGDELVTNHYNARFIDVELASQLTECYSPVHPTTRKQDAEFRTGLLDVVKNEFGLVTGSEEARDFAFPVVDFGEGTMTIAPANNAGYDWATPTEKPGETFVQYNMNPARRIPLHGLVYHDVHVPTWYTGDGLSKVPAFWDEKDLFNILYASMPLVMPPSAAYWQQHRERFLTSMLLTSAVFRECGFARMLEHRFLTANRRVQETRFDNGWTVAVNFDAADFAYGNRTLPAKGFVASDGVRSVYRAKESGHVRAVVDLDDRLFVQAYGQEVTVRGVRVNGAVLLKKDGESLLLSFIGDQPFVDLQPQDLPWPLQQMAAFTRKDRHPVPLQDLGNGWFRLRKHQDELFYRLEGDFTTGVAENANPGQPGVFHLAQNYPNPFNPETVIRFQLPASSVARLCIYSLTGQLVRTLVDGQKTAGQHQVVWDGLSEAGHPVSSGVYVMRLRAGSFAASRKILVVR